MLAPKKRGELEPNVTAYPEGRDGYDSYVNEVFNYP
jgi:hypothetical protein